MKLEYTWSKLGAANNGFYLIAFNSNDKNVNCIKDHSGRLMFDGHDNESHLIKCTRDHDHQAIAIAYVKKRNLSWTTEVESDSYFTNLISNDEDKTIFAVKDNVGTSYQEWVIESYNECNIVSVLTDELIRNVE